MTLAEFDRDVGLVFLGYAVLIAGAGVIKFLAQRSARSAEPVTETPGSRPVTSSAVVAAARVDGTGEATDRTWSTERGGDVVSTAPVQGTAVGVTPDRTTTATATEDSGGEVAVPASEETRPGATPGPELITQPREDPAVLGRDRAMPWSW